MQPKTLSAAAIALLFTFSTRAQQHNPYKEIGKQGHLLTLSNEKNDETFDEDSIQQIGSVLINVYTMQLVKLELTAAEQKLIDNSTAAKFLSTDPLYKDYANLTPYQFASNTPLSAVDLDGLEAKVAIAGQGQVGQTHYNASDNGGNAAWAMAMQVNGFKYNKAHTGSELVGILKDATKKEGGINTVVSFSHAGPVGIYMNSNEGFYLKNSYASEVFKSPLGPGAQDISDLKKSMDAGEVQFNDKALWIFAGCQTRWGPEEANLAYRMVKDLDVATIGASGYATHVENGKGETYKWTTTGTWTYTYKVYELNYYDKDNKLVSTHTVYGKHEMEVYNKAFNNDNKYTLKTKEIIKQENLGKEINLKELTKKLRY
jgi:hypothetical protein